jgi:integrase
MTIEEIKRITERGGIKAEQERELWDSLFLTKPEIQSVLDHVRVAAHHPFIYPMFVFVAHTGARRSEILRSQIDDFDFSSRTVLIREKKKSRSKSITYRRVPMTDLLCATMTDWFAHHPGGQYTICECLSTTRGKTRKEFECLTASEAHCHFKRTLKDSRWDKIKGFHTFRHSFASNLANGGVDQRIIDEWMGHQTEEMRRRYRHLFPDQQRKAIDSVFGGNGQ